MSSNKPRAPATSPVLPKAAGAVPTTPLAKRRPFILTGAVAFLAVAGALIGATLKSNKQVQEKQAIQKRPEVNQAGQIALLEATRSRLSAQKMQLEKKIGDLRDRQRRKAETDSEGEALMASPDTSEER